MATCEGGQYGYCVVVHVQELISGSCLAGCEGAPEMEIESDHGDQEVARWEEWGHDGERPRDQLRTLRSREELL